MLREILKEKTFSAHQTTEGIVVRKIKSIQTEQDYVEVLKCFYSYFSAVGDAINQFVDESVLPDIRDRRDSGYIQRDIEELGGSIDNLPQVTVPSINNTVEALCAMYVLEGSIMGGPYIVKMLEKRGIGRAFSFFEGYGSESGKMFGSFQAVLNGYADQISEERAIEVTNETFENFGEAFKELTLAE